MSWMTSAMCFLLGALIVNSTHQTLELWRVGERRWAKTYGWLSIGQVVAYVVAIVIFTRHP